MADLKEKFELLLSKFRPQSERKQDASQSDDTIIGARIRPLLEDEIESGQAAGVLPRRGTENVVDVHEMKATIRPVGDHRLIVRRSIQANPNTKFCSPFALRI
jgi:hypothetical protein